jgi:hypothetical protein
MDEPMERRLVALAVCIQVVLVAFIVAMVLDLTSGPDFDYSEPAKTIVTYVVQPGDSLWSIARRFRPEESPHLVISEILSVSGLPETRVQAYQQIRIPTARRKDG